MRSRGKMFEYQSRTARLFAMPGTQADIGNLKGAREARLDADRRASMSERLAKLHALCKQLGAIKGAAADR
jgi:hypothetical protein